MSQLGKSRVLVKGGSSKPLSTGHFNAVLLLSKNRAPVRISTGASLNPPKLADDIFKPIKLNIEDFGYKPPKKSVFKWSIKALLSPKSFGRSIPRTTIREGIRLSKEDHTKMKMPKLSFDSEYLSRIKIVAMNEVMRSIKLGNWL